MRGLFVAEWAAAVGIVTFRSVRNWHRPPSPGMLLATSGLFVILAVVASASDDAEKVAALLGAGLDIAAFMNLFEQFPPGSVKTTPVSFGAGKKQKTPAAGGGGGPAPRAA